MTAQTKVTDPLVSLATGRTLAGKLSDLINAADYGALAAASAAVNTAAINAAITAAAGSGFVTVNPGVAYTEASLVLVDGVTVIVFDATSGKVTFLVKNQGDAPTNKGGIEIKAQGDTGILLKSTDYGVSTDPVLQVVDATTGDAAAVELKWIDATEISAPSAPTANKGRVYVRDNGAGKTQLVVRFPTGAVQVIATEP